MYSEIAILGTCGVYYGQELYSLHKASEALRGTIIFGVVITLLAMVLNWYFDPIGALLYCVIHFKWFIGDLFVFNNKEE